MTPETQTPTPPPYQPTPNQPAATSSSAEKPSNGLAIAALILAFLAAPVGLILSIIALAKHRPGTSKGLAIAALIVSILTIVIGSILVFITLVAYQGIQQRAKDQTVTANANSISISLEAYAAKSVTYDADYNVHYSYPSSAQLKDSAWVKSNLTGLSTTVADALASGGDTYTYKAAPDGCANTDASPCTSYEITYRLSTGTKTVSSSVNEATANDNSSGN